MMSKKLYRKRSLALASLMTVCVTFLINALRHDACAAEHRLDVREPAACVETRQPLVHRAAPVKAR